MPVRAAGKYASTFFSPVREQRRTASRRCWKLIFSVPHLLPRRWATRREPSNAQWAPSASPASSTRKMSCRWWSPPPLLSPLPQSPVATGSLTTSDGSILEPYLRTPFWSKMSCLAWGVGRTRNRQVTSRVWTPAVFDVLRRGHDNLPRPWNFMNLLVSSLSKLKAFMRCLLAWRSTCWFAAGDC